MTKKKILSELFHGFIVLALVLGAFFYGVNRGSFYALHNIGLAKNELSEILNIDTDVALETFTILNEAYKEKPISKEELTKKIMPYVVKEYTQDKYADYIDKDNNYVEKTLSGKFRGIGVSISGEKKEVPESEMPFDLKELLEKMERLEQRLQSEQKRIHINIPEVVSDVFIEGKGNLTGVEKKRLQRKTLIELESAENMIDFLKERVIKGTETSALLPMGIEQGEVRGVDFKNANTESIKTRRIKVGEVKKGERNEKRLGMNRMPAPSHFKELPHSDGVRIEAVLEGTPAKALGLEAGDIIKKIDGKIITDGNQVSEAIQSSKESVVIEIERSGRLITKTFIPKDIYYPSMQGTIEKIQKNGILYSVAVIHIAKFGDNLVAEFEAFLKEHEDEIDAFYISVEFNGGGVLKSAEDLGNLFINSGEELYHYKDNITNKKEIVYSHKGQKNYFKPMIIAQNSHSASASELFTLSMKHAYGDKVIIFGSDSYGKGSIQTTYTLKNGDVLKFTIGKWYVGDYPNVSEQNIGPDVHYDAMKGQNVKEQGLEVLLSIL